MVKHIHVPIPNQRSESASSHLVEEGAVRTALTMFSPGIFLHRAPAAAGHAPPLRCTTNIQNAIAACQAGQVVQLGAGTFTIAEGNYVLLNKEVTLRGAGAGQTILQRTNGATLGSYVPGSNPSPIIIVNTQRFNNSPSAGTALTADAAQGSL
jgi:polygalacturonase